MNDFEAFCPFDLVVNVSGLMLYILLHALTGWTTTYSKYNPGLCAYPFFLYPFHTHWGKECLVYECAFF